MQRSMRLGVKLLIVSVLMVLFVAACGGQSNQAIVGSNSNPTSIQSADTAQVDSQGDQIDRDLQNLENDLNSVDTLNDFK